MSGEYHQLNVLLDQNGEAHGYNHSWHPTPGQTTTVKGQWFASKEEASANRNRALKRLGYTAPRWWQWWRWNEYKVAVDS